LQFAVFIDWQGASSLAEALAARRHYAAVEGDQLVLDPRFLLAEYVFDILLRDRQV
jgi:hypothetical protein